MKYISIIFLISLVIVPNDAIIGTIIGAIVGVVSDTISFAQTQGTINRMNKMLSSFTRDATHLLYNMNELYEKQKQQSDEHFVNILLELNGINGKFDSLTSQVTDMNGNILDISHMIQDIDEKINNIAELVATIDGKMDTFFDQLSDISWQITSQTLKLTLEIKFQNFFTLMSRLKRYHNELESVVIAYSTNATGLAYHIDQIITEYRKEYLEYEIVSYLDFEFIGSTSLIDSFINLVTIKETDFYNPILSTANKIVYDFYMSIFMTVNEGFGLLDLCYRMKHNLTNTYLQEDLEYVAVSKNLTLTKLMESLEISLQKVNAIEDMESYINLQVTGNANPQAFANVRKVYIKKVTAETGFVVTGVRFRVDRGIVFLQIQVGRLLMMGMIDQRSLHWQPLPDIINDSDVVQLDAGDMYFGMDKYFFADRFITGIKMMSVSNVLRLQLYGKKVEIFGLGIMKVSDLGLAKSVLAYNETSLSGSLQGISPNGNNGFQITNDKMLVLQQSLARYLDGSDITFDVKAPLAGIGFYHYTNAANYLGFIRPYVVALNYTTLF